MNNKQNVNVNKKYFGKVNAISYVSHQDIAEILLKVALNTIFLNQLPMQVLIMTFSY